MDRSGQDMVRTRCSAEHEDVNGQEKSQCLHEIRNKDNRFPETGMKTPETQIGETGRLICDRAFSGEGSPETFDTFAAIPIIFNLYENKNSPIAIRRVVPDGL